MSSVALPLLLLLFFHGDAQGEEDMCSVIVKVKRDTVHTAFAMQSLKINCTVIHCGMKLNVTWCKIENTICEPITKTEHITIKMKDHTETEDVCFLEFRSLSMNDSGLYRCKIPGNISSIGHSINVTVLAAKNTGDSLTNQTTTTTPINGHGEDQSPSLDIYIYISAGVLVLVIIVGVVCCVQKFKGSKQPVAAVQMQGQVQRDLQSSVPLSKDRPPEPCPRASPCPGLPDRPRSVRSPRAQRPPSVRSGGTPAPTPGPAPGPAPIPAKRSSRTKRTPVREAPPPRSSSGAPGPLAAVADGGSGGIYDNERDEAEPHIVYAALNHQVARKGPGHAYIPMEELTEYAAIRVS